MSVNQIASDTQKNLLLESCNKIEFLGCELGENDFKRHVDSSIAQQSDQTELTHKQSISMYNGPHCLIFLPIVPDNDDNEQ